MKSQMSALIDSELDAEGAEHLFVALKGEGELSERWSTYHLIGDAMRGESPLSADFTRRLMQQLEAEPTVLAPRRQAHKSSPWMTAVAGVAAVMFVGWVVLQQQAHAPAGDAAVPTLAQNTVSPASVSSYLLAHHATYSASGMQAGYYIQPVALNGNAN
ncbi:anti-sigma-E factor RseA [mine drainage metagenome]|uniref:Anti-sigma-E factor RseA n=1 Tax=mine drainage metagenome TaxID=410659 RepID=A0A1J5R4P9_9ZZZZ